MKTREITAQRIKERRQACGLTQTELAHLIGFMDKTAISKIERGVNGVSSQDLVKYAAVLKTNVSYLAGETDDPLSVWDRPLSGKALELTDEEELLIYRLRFLTDDQLDKVKELINRAYYEATEGEDAGV